MPKQARSHYAKSDADLRVEFWAAPDAALLDRKTAAAGLGYTVGWLEWAATQGGTSSHQAGPKRALPQGRCAGLD